VYRHANAGQTYPIADTAISRDHSIALATVACNTPELILVGITQNVRTRLINLAKADSRLRQRLGLRVCPDRAVDSLPEHLRDGAGRGDGQVDVSVRKALCWPGAAQSQTNRVAIHRTLCPSPPLPMMTPKSHAFGDISRYETTSAGNSRRLAIRPGGV
jgi:hypothetical protein